MTPPRRNEDDLKTKIALVNLNVSKVSLIRSFSQWNLSACQSSSRIRTWRKAWFMSLNRFPRAGSLSEGARAFAGVRCSLPLESNCPVWDIKFRP